jgi:hypothetical protein
LVAGEEICLDKHGDNVAEMMKRAKVFDIDLFDSVQDQVETHVHMRMTTMSIMQ